MKNEALLLPSGGQIPNPRHFRKLLGSLVALTLAVTSLCLSAQGYKVTNIISDGSVPATTTDAGFINPWAISTSGTWWINTQGTGRSYVVPAAGTINFNVGVPAASGLTTATGLPAGVVTTGGSATTSFFLTNGAKASFIFSTLDGTISGWNSRQGTTSAAVGQIMINNSAAGASYAGLALLNVGGNSYLLAPNFGTANKIEVYDTNFQPTALTGTFTDPNLPANYAPFAIHIIGTKIYVAYALRTATAPYRTVDGLGNGIVDVYSNTGSFVSRIATGGPLNSPWGVAIAPANFGVFSNDILIGNFGDGKINVFDPVSFAYLGQLLDVTGKSLAYASLWELLPGGTAITPITGVTAPAVSAGDTSTVYFTAGLVGEAHGLFAGISNDTSTGTPAMGLSASNPAGKVTAGGSFQSTIVVVPTRGFSGNVTFACSGLPAGATCFFGPTQVTVSSSAPVNTVLTIETSRAASFLAPIKSHGSGIAWALLFPVAPMLLLFRRRSSGSSLRSIGLLSLMAVLLVSSGVFMGCSGGITPIAATPAGTSNVVVTATSGSTTQTTNIALTIQ
jgi:uncharacterized protein (TIGR03118 family)